MISVATFRQDYNEFSSVSAYPAPMVQYWIMVAGMLLTNVGRWGNGSPTPVAPASTILDVANELFVAHNLALEKQAGDAAKRGGTPGTSIGPMTSKSVNGVSASYDVASAQEEGAGHWNSTTYGTRLYKLFMLFGAGPVQVGAECGFDPWEPGVTPAAFVPPVGTITFTANPTPNSTLTLGATAIKFVSGAPGSNQVQIGSSLANTMIALANLVSISDDPSISACNYALTTPSPPAFVLDVAYKELGPSGNSFVIATTVPGAVASGPTLVGPVATNDNGFGNDPWIGPYPYPVQTGFG